MYGKVYDLGDGLYNLHSWGPPEVDSLDNFAGNATETHAVSSFWECIEALSFKYVAAAGGGTRTPILSFFAGEAVPFAQVVAPFGLAAGVTGRFTFAVDVLQAGALSAAAIVTPIPRLLLLPKFSVALTVTNGAAGDAASEVRLYRQRYQPVEYAEYRRE